MGIPGLNIRTAAQCPGAIEFAPAGGASVGDASTEDASVGDRDLYIDANSMIHPSVTRKIGNGYASSTELFGEICKDLVSLIAYSKCNKVYIAIDGVAPLAKQRQQRVRRVTTYLDKRRRIEIAERNNMPIDQVLKFNSDIITAGTPFMTALSLYVMDYFVNDKNITVSPSMEVGEGEAKIFAQIMCKKNASNITIYGLDGDLIMRSIAIHDVVQNITLMRENTLHASDLVSSSRDPYLFINIDRYVEWIRDQLPTSVGRFAHDYIFITCMSGNDFVPAVFGLAVHQNGIELMLQAYEEVYSELNQPLLNESKALNQTFFLKWIKVLTRHEIHVKRYRTPEYTGLLVTDEDRFRRDIYNYENNIEVVKNKTIRYCDEKDIHLESDVEYYTNFGIRSNDEIPKLVSRYVEMMLWTVRYYTEPECPSWIAKYPYPYAPKLKDFVKFNHCSDLVVGVPSTPKEQLCNIILHESAVDVGLSKEDIPKIDLSKIKIDRNGHKKHYRCVVHA